jgi:hypothetical protein
VRLRRVTAVALMLASAGCAQASGEAAAVSVSLIQLIATPERYNEKRVRAVGVAQFAFEENALYLHKDDADLLNTSNAVWLDAGSISTEGLSGLPVFVEGVFTASRRGHLGAFQGTILVHRIHHARDRAHYETMLKAPPPPVHK